MSKRTVATLGIAATLAGIGGSACSPQKSAALVEARARIAARYNLDENQAGKGAYRDTDEAINDLIRYLKDPGVIAAVPDNHEYELLCQTTRLLRQKVEEGRITESKVLLLNLRTMATGKAGLEGVIIIASEIEQVNDKEYLALSYTPNDNPYDGKPERAGRGGFSQKAQQPKADGGLRRP